MFIINVSDAFLTDLNERKQSVTRFFTNCMLNYHRISNLINIVIIASYAV